MPKRTRGLFRPPGSGGLGEVRSYGGLGALVESPEFPLAFVCNATHSDLFGRNCSRILAGISFDGRRLEIQCPRCKQHHSLADLLLAEIIMNLGCISWFEQLRSLEHGLREVLRQAYPIFDDLRRLLDWEFPGEDNLPLDPLTLLKHDTRVLTSDQLLVPIPANLSRGDVRRMAKKVGFVVEGQELLERDLGWPLKEEKFLALETEWRNQVLCFETSPYPYGSLNPSQFQPLGATETIFVLALLQYWLKEHQVTYRMMSPPWGLFDRRALAAGSIGSAEGTESVLTYLCLENSRIKVSQGRIGESLIFQDGYLRTTEAVMRHGTPPVLSLIHAHPLERQLSTVFPELLETAKPVSVSGGGASCSV